MFLGAFDRRKGLKQVLEAWPMVSARLPDARLRLLGKGPLEPLAVEAARSRDEVDLLVDPSRDVVHERLRTARTLVLLSQPSRTWREQVGLPILEGLAHGCEVVATSETGLASWLVDNGHRVVDPAATAQQVADAIVSSLESGRSPAEIIDTLPAVDGRKTAEGWMFGGAAERSGDLR